MDLQTSVFLLFVLFTAGHSLSCYECISLTGSCADQQEKPCPSGASKCMSITSVSKVGDISINEKIKGCAADCASGSMNLGIVRTSSACCNTDRCNVQDAPDPSTNVPNGKKCYYCDGKSCSNTVSCSGSEDRCITATESSGGQTVVVKGCVSKSLCGTTTSVRDVRSESCCEGNLCNSAKSVTQSFLFLCCSLLSFILLH
ncbi:urokinase plasminogen activator surface receptor-like [Sinocyclocheilus grahami]|uniref:Urokinase plasminogen activator surface receptor-like n=1 Tax=Sinocyclocheilus grahami TaxID=75366 RepID=A0A672KQC5_SINGR|nr:PREDICTED: urokinase plasminogen activator surface receptor-like [Sinocyclocheilus grahami]